MLTRRCTQRQFLLNPGKLTNQIAQYVLGWAAAKHRILLHCFNFLANHEHTQLTDPFAAISDFARDLHMVIAKARNASLGRWENLYDNSKPSYVRLEDPEAIRENTRYILTNPVKDGLVPRVKDWPGARSLPRFLDGGRITVKRPPVFFKDTDFWPDQVIIELARPPGFEDMTTRDYRAMVTDDIKKVERDVQAEYATEKKHFLGSKTILRQSPDDRPKTREPRRKLSPRVKTKDKWRRIEALQRIKTFEDEYRVAFLQFRDNKQVEFPCGTLWMRVFAGVRVRPPP